MTSDTREYGTHILCILESQWDCLYQLYLPYLYKFIRHFIYGKVYRIRGYEYTIERRNVDLDRFKSFMKSGRHQLKILINWFTVSLKLFKGHTSKFCEFLQNLTNIIIYCIPCSSVSSFFVQLSSMVTL